MKIYSFDRLNRALHQLVVPSFKAPYERHAPYQNHPKQAVGTEPHKREVIDFSEAGPVLELVAEMHYLETVQNVPVRQPGYILRAAKAAVGPNRVDVPDQRTALMTYPANDARSSYDFTGMSAPARLQSVPGYTVRQTQITRTSSGYPSQALKAPRPNSGGGQCDG